MPRPPKKSVEDKAKLPVAVVPPPTMVPAPVVTGLHPAVPGPVPGVPQRVVDNDSFLRVRDSVSPAQLVYPSSAFLSVIFPRCVPRPKTRASVETASCRLAFAAQWQAGVTSSEPAFVSGLAVWPRLASGIVEQGNKGKRKRKAHRHTISLCASHSISHPIIPLHIPRPSLRFSGRARPALQAPHCLH